MTQIDGEIYHVHGLENEYATQSNLQIQCIPIKLPVVFFTELEQIISQSVWKYKKP